MKSSVLTGTIVLASLIGTCIAGSLVAHQERSAVVLEATIESEQAGGSYHVVLNNRSDEYLCIEERAFDTMRSGVRLTDSTGKDVRRHSYADGPADLERGFDFLPAYLFLKPHQKRVLEIDLANFDVTGGVYQYELIASYFRCRDIVGSSTKGDIPGFSLHSRGTVQLGPGKGPAR